MGLGSCGVSMLEVMKHATQGIIVRRWVLCLSKGSTAQWWLLVAWFKVNGRVAFLCCVNRKHGIQKRV